MTQAGEGEEEDIAGNQKWEWRICHDRGGRHREAGRSSDAFNLLGKGNIGYFER